MGYVIINTKLKNVMSSRRNNLKKTYLCSILSFYPNLNRLRDIYFLSNISESTRY